MAASASSPSLFIGGLPRVTDEDIRGLLSQFGTVASIAPKKGYAFAKFVDPDAAQAACQLDGTLFGDKVLAVRIQAPENMKKKTTPASQPSVLEDSNPSLFIGALPKEMQEEDLLALLSQFGTVASLALKKGYAFATFLEPHAAQAACVLNGTQYGTKLLAVRIQTSENMKKKSKAPVTAAPSASCSLFIGGLPTTATEEDIHVLTEPYGPIRSVSLHRGYAFVNYHQMGSAELAATYLNNIEWGGKKLAARPQLPKASSGGAATAPIIPFVKKHPSLFVGGLQTIATEREVKLLFSPYGNIVKMTMLKGFCFIDYEQPGSAEKAAAALNGFVMDGKPLGVRIQSESDRKAVSAKSKPRFQPY